MVLIMILNLKKYWSAKAIELNCASDLRSNNHPQNNQKSLSRIMILFPNSQSLSDKS